MNTLGGNYPWADWSKNERGVLSESGVPQKIKMGGGGEREERASRKTTNKKTMLFKKPDYKKSRKRGERYPEEVIRGDGDGLNGENPRVIDNGGKREKYCGVWKEIVVGSTGDWETQNRGCVQGKKKKRGGGKRYTLLGPIRARGTQSGGTGPKKLSQVPHKH